MAAEENRNQTSEATRQEARIKARNYAANRAIRSSTGQKAVRAAGKAAANIAKNIGTKAATTAASLVGGLATGGFLTAAQAAIFATKNAKNLVKYGIGAAMFLPTLINTAVGIGITVLNSWIIFATIASVFVFTFIITIINSGAYIVPAGEGINWGGNTPGTTCGEGESEIYSCFEFDNTWGCSAEADKNRMKRAIDRIDSKPLICNQVTRLSYSNIAKNYGGEIEGPNHLLFHNGSKGSFTSDLVTLYTLAHEMGHVLDARYSSISIKYANVSPTVGDGQALPSYTFCHAPFQIGITGCTHYENRAEAMGLYLMLPTQQADVNPFENFEDVVNFQTQFLNHYEFTRQVFQ